MILTIDPKPKSSKSLSRVVSSKYLLAVTVITFLVGCQDVTQEDSTQPKALTASAPLADEKGTNKSAEENLAIWPQLTLPVAIDPQIESRISGMLETMTIEQKIAQMIQPEIRDISVEDMRRYGFGSYLNGGGAFPDDNKHARPADWIALAEKMYQASVDDSLDGSVIPTMWGTDAVHGHNNVIGATLFPHNIGLGAANNPELIKAIAGATAQEVMATGIDWVFAPTVAVARDDRWGRTYESYSENPLIVKRYAAAIVEGLQGEVGKNFLDQKHVIATVKHFIGDGGTQGGDDQGNNIDSEKELFDIHAQGYVAGLSSGAQTVMASFNSWQGNKLHGSQYLLTDVLKKRMGFDGLVVGDWNGHGQVAGCQNESCPKAINAGLDIFMVPTQAWKPLFENTLSQVERGEIPLARINDAVSRILRVKLRAGLFDKPSPANRPLSGKTELIGNAEHRQIARQAVRESLVLLKNEGQTLPLSGKQKILVAGDAADNIGKQSGGWTITWQGTNNQNEDFPGATSIYSGIKQSVLSAGGQVELAVDGKFSTRPDVAIVVFGEEPYAEGNGDLDNLEYQRGNKKDLELLKRLKQQKIPVVAIFISGRPLWVNPELNAADAFVAAWLPGTEGQGIADVIFKKADGSINFDFKGRLSFSWPAMPDHSNVNLNEPLTVPLFPFGFGLDYQSKVEAWQALSEKNTVVKAQDIVRPLLSGTVKKPWKLVVETAKEKLVMSSSVIASAAVKVRTIDKQVQEDARRVNWLDNSGAQVTLASDFPEDLRHFVEANGSLTLEVKIEQKLNQPLLLNMGCQTDCQQGLDIAPWLNQQTISQWHQLNIDLACFSQRGTDFGSVFKPLQLQSKVPAVLSFAEVKLLTKAEKQSDIRCD